MLKMSVKSIIERGRRTGWISEPDAKKIFSLYGLSVPRFLFSRTIDGAIPFADSIGYPVVAKVVSPLTVHKSEKGGVITGIGNRTGLADAFRRLSSIEGFTGIIVEEMLKGTELIIGAKKDYQFGPVILLGIGGTAVEVYQDIAIRMAPLSEKDVHSMIKSLVGEKILDGYRGSEPVNLGELSKMVLAFSKIAMDMRHYVESIDLNPVMCSSTRCVVADARIMLIRGTEGDYPSTL
jgi:acetate---CoA ligase (ADP-forming) subunit beta